MVRHSERVTKLRKKRFLSRNKLKTNAFDTQISQVKFPVIGKSEKHSKGQPLLSRSRAQLKRKNTLLKEYNNVNRTNQYVDKRIDNIRKQQGANVDLEGVAEQLTLTHRGQHLQYEGNPQYQSNNDVDFIQTTYIDDIDNHFGGNFDDDLFQPVDDNKSPSYYDDYMSKNSFMQSIVDKSNQHQAEVDELKQIYDTLDTEWSQFKDAVSRIDVESTNASIKTNADSTTNNDYDRELLMLNSSKRVAISVKNNEDELAEDAKILKVDPTNQSQVEKVTSTSRPIRSYLNSKISADSLGIKDKEEFSKPQYLKNYEPETSQFDLNTPIDCFNNDSALKKTIPLNSKQLYQLLNVDKKTDDERLEYLKSFETTNKHLTKDCYQKFLYVLVEYYSEYSHEISQTSVNDQLIRVCFLLTKIDVRSACDYFQQILLKLNEKLDESMLLSSNNDSDSHLLQQNFINSSIKFIHLISCIFPMNSYKHPVTSPANLLSTKILNLLTSNEFCFDFEAIHELMTNIIRWVRLSKKIVPEMIKCWERIMYNVLLDMSPSQGAPIIFGISRMEIKTRLLKSSQIELMLTMLKQLITIYENDPCFNEIFSNCFNIVQNMRKSENSSSAINYKIEAIVSQFNSMKTVPKPPVKLLIVPTRTVNQLEPNIIASNNYNPFSKNKSSNKAINERQKLKHKYKREFKGAIREIRKDNQFLAKVQLEETLANDRERARKVKELFSLIAKENNYDDDHSKAKGDQTVES